MKLGEYLAKLFRTYWPNDASPSSYKPQTQSHDISEYLIETKRTDSLGHEAPDLPHYLFRRATEGQKVIIIPLSEPVAREANEDGPGLRQLQELMDENASQWTFGNCQGLLSPLGHAYIESRLCLVVPDSGQVPLKQFLTRSGRDPWPYLLQLAEALTYLHAQGIVHGCLLPSNAAVIDEKRAVLRGHGVASTLGSLAGISRSLLEAARYLAPERIAEGKTEASKKSDVYEFVCLLLEFWTGHPPYRRLLKPSQILDAREEGKSPVDHMSKPWPQNLSSTLNRCVSFDPKERLDMDKVTTVLREYVQPTSRITGFVSFVSHSYSIALLGLLGQRAGSLITSSNGAA